MGTYLWPVRKPLPLQGSTVQAGEVRRSCLNPRTCMPLTEELGPGDGIWLATEGLLHCGALGQVHGLTYLCTYPDTFCTYFFLFQSGKDPRTLCSMGMPLGAQCFACLLACVSPGASCGRAPPQERVTSMLTISRVRQPDAPGGMRC